MQIFSCYKLPGFFIIPFLVTSFLPVKVQSQKLYETVVVNSNQGLRPLEEVISMDILLNLVEPDNSIHNADGALVEFADNFCACVNMQDAAKFTNSNETFSLLRNGTSLSIERRPIIIENDTLFLRLIQSKQRNYQLVFNANNLDQPNLVAFLEDKYTGIAMPVNMVGSTTVNFTINGDAASINRDRFIVVFKQAVVLPVTFSDVKAWQQGDNIAVGWKVENQLNTGIYEVEKSINGRNFIKVNTQPVKAPGAVSNVYEWLDMTIVEGDNFYRIRNTDHNGAVAYSKVVKVSVGSRAGGFSVYPNPVTDGVVALKLNNMPRGKYSIRLVTVTGQVLLMQEINLAGENVNEKIVLSKDIKKGTYTLVITNPQKSKTILIIVY